MAKYRMCGGLAITPEKDMMLLKNMSKKGWHLVGMRGLGFLYRFEEGESCDYDYALNMEKEIDDDMLSYYEASGWSPVVISPGIQIFRAKEGTAPIFSDRESEVEVLQRNQKLYGRWASMFGIMLVVWLVVTYVTGIEVLSVIAMVALINCFVFTFYPYIGFGRSLKKLRKND